MSTQTHTIENLLKDEDLFEKLEALKKFCKEHDIDFNSVKEADFFWVAQGQYWKVESYAC